QLRHFLAGNRTGVADAKPNFHMAVAIFRRADHQVGITELGVRQTEAERIQGLNVATVVPAVTDEHALVVFEIIARTDLLPFVVGAVVEDFALGDIVGAGTIAKFALNGEGQFAGGVDVAGEDFGAGGIAVLAVVKTVENRRRLLVPIGHSNAGAGIHQDDDIGI